MTGPRHEAVRKVLHLLLSLVAAAVVWWLPSMPAATVLAAATALALAIEVARRVAGGFGRVFDERLGMLLRPREARGLTGATTLSIGYTVAAVVTPGLPAVAGILATGVGDAAAAVVGKRFGRLRYPGGKSVEGSAAFFVVVALALAVLGFGPLPALVVALLLTLLEAPSLPLDDNLYLPLVTGIVVQLTGLLAGLTFFS